ncbi:TPA: hypothetical protein ENS27_04695 [bacterium]|nr:hypothetical protein [bacterium]
MKILKYILVMLPLMFISISPLYAKARATVTGTWNLIITEQDLQNGAGSDLKNTYESPSDQVIVDVDMQGVGSDSWIIYTRKSPPDANWPSRFRLFIRRSGNGQGPPPGSISGGTTYQELTENDVFFYEGVKQRKNIPHQFKLTGVSALVPAGTYITTVYYTIVSD